MPLTSPDRPYGFDPQVDLYGNSRSPFAPFGYRANPDFAPFNTSLDNTPSQEFAPYREPSMLSVNYIDSLEGPQNFASTLNTESATGGNPKASNPDAGNLGVGISQAGAFVGQSAELITDAVDKDPTKTTKGEVAIKTGAGALKGAGVGAQVGSFAGPVGTAVGAGVGAVVGGVTSFAQQKKIQKQEEDAYMNRLRFESAGLTQFAQNGGLAGSWLDKLDNYL